MYDNLNAAIRSVDDQRLILFEPVTWADFGTGFDHVPGGEVYKNRSALAYHFYVPPGIQIFK
jgi:endoglycosylceramidase